MKKRGLHNSAAEPQENKLPAAFNSRTALNLRGPCGVPITPSGGSVTPRGARRITPYDNPATNNAYDKSPKGTPSSAYRMNYAEEETASDHNPWKFRAFLVFLVVTFLFICFRQMAGHPPPQKYDTSPSMVEDERYEPHAVLQQQLSLRLESLEQELLDQKAAAASIQDTACESPSVFEEAASSSNDAIVEEVKKELTETISSLEKEKIHWKHETEQSVERIAQLESIVRRLSEEHLQNSEKQQQSAQQAEQEIDPNAVINSLLKSQKVDWGQSTTGGEIVTYLTTGGLNRDAWMDVLISQLSVLIPKGSRYAGLDKPRSAPPDTVIDGTKIFPAPGQCFSFEGAGNITIHLPRAVHVNEVTLEHLPVASNPHPATTPKHFAVYTLPERVANEEGVSREEDFLLRKQIPFQRRGDFVFDQQSRAKTYILEEPTNLQNFPTRRVTFEFVSNHGGDYTCVYRLKIHGDPWVNV